MVVTPDRETPLMDVLFDGLDRLMDAARQRFPVTMTTLSLVAWGLVAAAGSYLFGTESLALGGALAAGPVILLFAVAIWGVGRLRWPAWPLGMSTLVFIGGIFAPQAEQWKTGQDWAVPLVVFIYVEVFLGAIGAVDELRRRRERRRGHEDTPATERTARRRVLQLKVLVATLLLAIGTPLGDLPSGIDAVAEAGGAPNIVKIGAVFVLLVITPTVFLLAFVAVFVRVKGLAVATSIGILALFTIYLAVLPPTSRSALVIEDGWLVLTTAYLWVKAATRWYWPLAKAKRPDQRRPTDPAWIQPTPH
jgi:hypothetical protein